MISIITGDIINSRAYHTEDWMILLKQELLYHGETPKQWEIYRGDSFQLEIAPEKALKTAIRIKATIKQVKGLDVRLAIGTGKKDYDATKITEANGSAFVNSGICFEGLKKITLAIKTPDDLFNQTINIMLELALLTMNSWTPTTANLIKTALDNPNANQTELAKITNSTQGNISQGLKRGGYDEISKMIQYYSQNA